MSSPSKRPKRSPRSTTPRDAQRAEAERLRREAEEKMAEAKAAMAEAKAAMAEAKPKASRPRAGLVVESVDVHYGKVQALRNVSLQIQPGEMVALLGANGAGKSTTLRAISGMVAPSAGSIVFNGESISGLPAYDVVSHGVAHLPEGRELFPTLTVEENLRFGYYSRLKTERAGYRDQLEQVFELFPRLLERRSQAAGTMSGGEQQMLGAARALMSKPKLLLVDELSLGLAPMIVEDLFGALHEVNKTGTAVLIVEQFIHLALENTKRAYVLAKGEIVLEGKSKDLADDPDLIEAYLGGEGGDSSESEKSANNGAKKAASKRKKTEAGRRRD